jgi:nucleoid DNA-binding protein
MTNNKDKAIEKALAEKGLIKIKDVEKMINNMLNNICNNLGLTEPEQKIVADVRSFHLKELKSREKKQ